MMTLTTIKRYEAEQLRAEGLADLDGVSYDQFASRWVARERPADRARRLRARKVDPATEAALCRLWRGITP